MDDKQRVELTNLLNKYHTEETTEKIRELKHSKKIKYDVRTIMDLKHKFKQLTYSNKKKFKEICTAQASFLYSNYTNIFHKLVNDEIDHTILFNLIYVLEKIENGELDQHDGSYQVGQILKKIYIDGALKRDENRKQAEEKKFKKPTKNISWSEFKTMQPENEQ